MNYTQFHGNKFLFVNENANEFALEKESKDVDLTMYYKHTGTFDGIKNYKCSFINKDESEAELCGNALLALMKQEFLGEYAFHTKAGVITGVNTDVGFVLEMPEAVIKRDLAIPNVVSYFDVKIGNEHFIALSHTKEDFDYMNEHFSTQIPTICNIHSVIKKDANTFEVRCFERGVGETDACGSGAYAVGVTMMKHCNLSEVKIIMKGGEYIVKDGLLIVKK